MSSAEKQIYEFGPFRLDAGERLLLRGGEVVRLTPKEFETLLALVRGRGRVRSKRELLEEVWPETYVEEATLAQNVFTLRKALARGNGDDDGPQYIETVPRRGYRLAAEVRELTGGPETSKEEAEPLTSVAQAPHTTGDGRAAASEITAPPRPAREVGGHPRRAAFLITLGVLAAVSLLVYAVFRFAVRPQTTPPPRPPAFQSMKVTRLPVAGAVREAAISPDGAYLAYVSDEPGAPRGGVWVRQVAAASNNQQLAAPAEGVQYGGVTFSPDAQHVYFLAFKGPDADATLYQVPVFGGTLKKVLEGGNGPYSLSPDGRRVAYITGRFGTEMALMLGDLAGGVPRKLVTRTPPDIFGLPVWSPDGKWVACVYGSDEDRGSQTALVGFTAFDAADGSETRVTDRRWYGIEGMAWLPDSSGLLVNTAEAELSPSQIWQIPFPSGEPRRVTNDLSTYIGTSVTRDGSALVTVQTDRVPNIWVAPGGDAARARQITTGAGKFEGFYGLAWAPDGRIVYSSVAGGNWDIWVMNADGTGQRQLTVGARSNYGPSVSADGRFIYFVSNRAGGPFHIWRMDSDGSNPKQLTSQGGENFPHATPDGRFVVYATIGFGKDAAVWKVPAEGGEPVRLTDKPASWPFLSPDGKWFVCTYGVGQPMNSNKLAVISIDGGEPVKLYDIGPTFRANTVWLPDNRGIAYLDTRTGVSNVFMQPMSGGKPVQLTDFKTDHVGAYDWSRDNRLAASRSVETTGVVLIKDFK
ncbi:MAG TPA: winged helix-turn-helix domain-containing protein [Pyrinomonadaceae bacterium]|jgi:Tol biopolymer transport system component/DNA-binding winged helix-turn-helix (wHTH) protein|nr:winged helix-turn-helix domain-containing protein [Pyrinomonadaceae bacterium]